MRAEVAKNVAMMVLNTFLLLIVLGLRILTSLYWLFLRSPSLLTHRYILYKDSISRTMLQSIFILLPAFFNLILFVMVKDFVGGGGRGRCLISSPISLWVDSAPTGLTTEWFVWTMRLALQIRPVPSIERPLCRAISSINIDMMRRSAVARVLTSNPCQTQFGRCSGAIPPQPYPRSRFSLQLQFLLLARMSSMGAMI